MAHQHVVNESDYACMYMSFSWKFSPSIITFKVVTGEVF